MSVTYVSKKNLRDNRRNTVNIPNYTGILAGGNMSGVYELGSLLKNITRLNSDNTYDDTFFLHTANTSSSTFGFGGSDVDIINIQSDGKIIAGGLFSTYMNTSSNRLVRINTDGTRDSTFSAGTGFVMSGGNAPVRTIEFQSDGKIIIGGNFISYNGTNANNIIRLNSNGTVDSTFNIGTGFNFNVQSVAIQSDGKIIVFGLFTTYQGLTYNRIIRLNTDGSIDTSFNVGTGFSSAGGFYNVYGKIIIQPDGKIIIGCDNNLYNGVTINKIVRLNTDGSIDTSFNTGTGFGSGTGSAVLTMFLQPDGKLIVGGDFTTYQGVTVNRLVRINTDGSRDTSFNTGVGFDNDVRTIDLQSDGKIVAGGDFTNFNNVLVTGFVKLNNDGSFNSRMLFSATSTPSIRSIKVYTGDKAVIVGSNVLKFNKSFKIKNRNEDITVNRISAKLLETQASDFTKTNIELGISTTGNVSGFNSTVNRILVDSTGKIFIGGLFTQYIGISANRIIKLDSNMDIDESFNYGTGLNGEFFTIVIQSDNKIILGGSFTTYQGVSYNRIIRLNSDGSVDSSFNIGTGFNDTVNRIELQSDGKILVVGNFTTYQGTTRNRIVRLNNDGSYDSTFNIGTGFNNNANSLAIQRDGKVLVGGAFTTYQATTRNRIIRLNSDGSVDTSFNIGTGFGSNTVSKILIQSDEKIIASGSFAQYQGVNYNGLIRLNTNGSIDTSFVIGTGFDSTINDIILNTKDELFVAGNFISYQTFQRLRLAKLNYDGSLDSNFKLGAISNINAIALY